MSKWEYGGHYKKYDMTGDIAIGTGIVRVHDIFERLPSFMHNADCLFVDPPCSRGNINTFYTKADIGRYQDSYTPFASRLFECLVEIMPKTVFIEVFKSNRQAFEEKLRSMYKDVFVYESTYYHRAKNKCWILVAGYGGSRIPEGMDEEDFIKWACKNVDYKCIGDLCMGRGLVGYHAFLNNRSFVGTELNAKRLAVLVDKITRHVERI